MLEMAAPSAQAQDLPEEGPSPAAAGHSNGNASEKYGPEYFERFAPRNALDMLNRVPGFAIDQPRTGETDRRREQQQRGFGQASESILINRERLSSKSDSVADQLSRIPARNVLWIEILDGASLDIPGLSGQVANIVVGSRNGISGQFSWSPEYRPLASQLSPYKGKASITGTFGDFDLTVGVDVPNYTYSARGPTYIRQADGTPIELRETLYTLATRRPNFTATAGFVDSGDVSANLNISYVPVYSLATEVDQRANADGTASSRDRVFDFGGYQLEIGGDVEFDVGLGRLKLIGLNARDKLPAFERAIFSYSDGAPDTGTLFDLDRLRRERIGRAEYNWPIAGLDWQWSGEAAFNKLDNAVGLFVLDNGGEFVALPFPGGNGGVSEDRYETILTATGTLSPSLTFQLGGGAEFSTIKQTGVSDTSRSFTRPKGTLSLAWKVDDRASLAFELARRVGQLEFSDFLATVSLSEETENAANAELVPQQSWEAELEIASDLGAWGNATLKLFHQRIKDLVDFIALPSGAAAKGNIDHATRSGAELDATIELAPLGWQGARLDIVGKLEHSRLTDPVDGSSRPISNGQPHRLSIDLRHDIPGSAWAWGGGFLTSRTGQFYRVGEFGRTYSGPDTWSIFGEHKDVFGLTVRAEVIGLFGPHRRQTRTIFDGLRGRDPVLFFEDRDQQLGEIYVLSVSGNF